MTPQEVLIEAANLIRKYGHVKGWFGHPTDGFCAVGAIARATRVHWSAPETVYLDAMKVREGAVDALGDFVGETVIARWNDAPERTKEEVIEALEGAAK